MKKITKKMVREVAGNLEREIESMKEYAKNEEGSSYGRHIAEAKGNLSVLESVINSGYPINSKRVREIIENN